MSTITTTPERRFVERAKYTESCKDIDKELVNASLSLNFMGTWVPNNEYRKNDIVTDTTDNSLYICEVDILNSLVVPSKDNAHWHLFLPGMMVEHIEILPVTAIVGTLTDEQFAILSKNVLNYIVRNGEIYNLQDVSDNAYSTYVHCSIDTSQSEKPAVIRVIRVNNDDKSWELTQKELVTADLPGGDS